MSATAEHLVSQRRPDDTVLPVILLAVLLLVTWARFARDPGFAPRLEPDSKSYIDTPLNESTLQESPVRALSYYRTLGYPYFLNTLSGAKATFPAVPVVQAVLYSSAVFLFFLALAHYTGSRWLALAATVPLPFALVVRLTSTILTESLAASLLLAAVAATLWIAAKRPPRWAWVLLATATFCAYQVRPTTQWLVAWIPFAVLLLAQRRARTVRLQTGLAAALATTLPWIAFSTLRLVTVGHFGLVSFGGTNLSAISTFLVDERAITALPDDVRPTARTILKRRERNGWPQLTWGADVERYFFKRYNLSLWKVAYRSANWHMHRQTRHTGRGAFDLWGRSFPVERDRRLQSFAVGVIGQRPGGYAAWVLGAARFGVESLLRLPWVLIGLALCAIAAMRWVQHRWQVPANRADRRSLLPGIALVAHSAGALLLVSAVSFPMWRYLAEISLLLPSGLILIAAAFVREAGGQWAVGSGQWAVGSGQWAVGSGQWAVKKIRLQPSPIVRHP